MEQKSGGGPERIRMTRSQNTPYSRPADKRKSFLSKVKKWHWPGLGKSQAIELIEIIMIIHDPS